jgi:endonuclease-3
MSSPNRTALLTKAHRVLKQHYKSVPPPERPLLEHLLFAACLENAPYDAAEKIYTYLSKHFFDWNEVRVSTVNELAEVMRHLPEPATTASNLKRILQGTFEATYSFDLESLKKKNIGEGIKWLEKLGGTTPFSVAYVTHAALGGHAIPLDRGAWEVLVILGVVTEAEAASGKGAGLERAIPKNKGAEFSSLLHQLAADWIANPHSPTVRKTLLDINRDAKDRFPKRGAKKEPPPPPAAARDGSASGKQKGDDAHKADKSKAAEKKSSELPTARKPDDKAHAGRGADKHAAPEKSPAAADKHRSAKDKAEPPPAHKPAADKPAIHKHEAAKSHKPEKADHKKPAAAAHKPSATARARAASGRKSATKQLAKRKPR